MDSLQFLVINTEGKQPEMVEFNIRAYERNFYDFIALIPSIEIGVDDSYIKFEEVGGAYTIYIKKDSMDESKLTFLTGDSVCGVSLKEFDTGFLVVDPEVPESFVKYLDMLYPNKVLYLVNREIPNVVFDVYTRGTNNSLSRINVSNSAYRSGFISIV